MRQTIYLAAFFLILALVPQVGWGGVSEYLDVPAIPGAGAPQGYPTSMQIQSFTWTPNAKDFQVNRITDANSPIFQGDVLSGKVLHNVNVLFYKAPNESHDPYVTYNFGDSIVSSISFSGSGSQEKENIQFAYQTSKILYLKIPGITGIASAPGYNNVLPLNSITFDSSGFTINRDLDASSPSLRAAVISGANLGTASLLMYNLPGSSNSPADPPYDILDLLNPTATSYQTIAGPASTTEQVTFAFSDFNDAPEPGTLAVLGIGIGGLILRPARRRC